MRYENNKAVDLKIAYIGGGSRGWAWGLMSDLAQADDISGDVFLYDIDFEAAQHNEIIGNKIKDLDECKSSWNYKAVETIGEALTGADFVIISILPGTHSRKIRNLSIGWGHIRSRRYCQSFTHNSHDAGNCTCN